MTILSESLRIVEITDGFALYGTTTEGKATFLAHLGDGADGLPDAHDPDLPEDYGFTVVQSGSCELVECPQCGGNGLLFPGATAGMWAGLVRWPADITGEPCDLCDASGEVNTQVAEEYEASVLRDLDD